MEYAFKSYKSLSEKGGCTDVNDIYDFCEDDDGNILTGTEYGLFKTNGTTFTKLSKGTSKDSGLVSNSVQSLLFDNDHKLWIATFEGLSCYFNNSFTNYTVQNGLPNFLCTSAGIG